MQETITETELLQVLRASMAGKKDPFGSIVKRYQSLVCAITYGATGDLAKSRELARETFIRAWNSLEQVKEPRKFGGWLCRIARNLTNKSMRRQRFEAVLDDGPPQEPTSGRAAQSKPLRIDVSEKHLTLVQEALQELPQQYREVIILYHYAGHHQSKVAADLNLSEDQVGRRLVEAYRLLKPEIASLIENVLVKTAPPKSFAAGVLAAIGKVSQPTSQSSRFQIAAEGARESAGAAEGEILTPPPTTQRIPAASKMSRAAVFAAFAGTALAGLAWILPTSLMARDWHSAAAILGTAALIFVVGTMLCLRYQNRRWQILIGAAIALCLLNLVAVNLRWSIWTQALGETPGYNPAGDLSRRTINIIIAAVLTALLLLLFGLSTRKKGLVNKPPQ